MEHLADWQRIFGALEDSTELPAQADRLSYPTCSSARNLDISSGPMY